MVSISLVVLADYPYPINGIDNVDLLLSGISTLETCMSCHIHQSLSFWAFCRSKRRNGVLQLVKDHPAPILTFSRIRNMHLLVSRCQNLKIFCWRRLIVQQSNSLNRSCARSCSRNSQVITEKIISTEAVHKIPDSKVCITGILPVHLLNLPNETCNLQNCSWQSLVQLYSTTQEVTKHGLGWHSRGPSVYDI
jgi:hypothetical protein